MAINLTSPYAQAWKKRLNRLSQSGMSIAAFCRREKVSQASLYTWRKRFTQASPNSATPQTMRLVPVKVLPNAVPQGNPGIELVFPSGHRLRFSADIEPERLAAFAGIFGVC
jgi:transposase-like protein